MGALVAILAKVVAQMRGRKPRAQTPHAAALCVRPSGERDLG